MRCYALLLLLSGGLLLAGCSADSGADGGDTDIGGQTGSLIPTCGVSLLTNDGHSVPSGESAFVLHTGGCRGPVTTTGIKLVTSGGAPVTVDVEPLGDGNYLVKGETNLAAGEYHVKLPWSAAPTDTVIEVADPAPAPTQIGELFVTQTGCEAGELSLQLDATLLPYLPLTQFSIEIDGQHRTVWSDYGALRASDGYASIAIDQCANGCLEPGTHQLTLIATIAGQTAQPTPVTVAFEVACGSSGGDCALRHQRAPINVLFPLLTLTGLGAIAVRRRRRLL